MRAGLLKSARAIVDVKNGYISLRNGAADRYVLTVFRRTAGSYLVALSHTRPRAALPTRRPNPSFCRTPPPDES
jgi:hypothetical protein